MACGLPCIIIIPSVFKSHRSLSLGQVFSYSWTVTTVSRYTCTVQAVHAVGCRCLRVTSAAAVPEQWLITWHGQALPADDCGIPSDDERMDAPACRLAARGTSRSYHHDRAH